MVIPSTDPANQSLRLPLSLKSIYAFGHFNLTILISTVSFFLLIFYTDVAKVAPALAGTALLVGKIWDVVNDPLVGWFSDRTHSRFGRRRIYIILGALPLAVTTFLLWSMPPGLSTVWAFVWIAVTYILFDTFFTIVFVPYWSLAPELTHDYDERTSLTTITGLGMVLGFFGGSILMRVIIGSFENPSLGYMVAGGILGGFVGASLLFVAWRIKEPSQLKAKNSELNIGMALKTTLQNQIGRASCRERV